MGKAVGVGFPNRPAPPALNRPRPRSCLTEVFFWPDIFFILRMATTAKLT